MSTSINEKYLEHRVFKQLAEYGDFYYTLSMEIMGWKTSGIYSLINLDANVYTSIQGTLESIKDILIKGRINDSYALLRKYYDSTIINIYTNLYLSDNFSIDNFIVNKIENWINGVEKLPRYRDMSEYIKKSPKLAPISSLLHKDETYENIRTRCNDHTHYNYYYNLRLNDNRAFIQNSRLNTLNKFSRDLDAILIQHLSYLFYINDHYMMASDYIDSLEMGMQPEEGSQYFVAPFIQEIFDKVIKIERMDIVLEIKMKTTMELL